MYRFYNKIKRKLFKGNTIYTKGVFNSAINTSLYKCNINVGAGAKLTIAEHVNMQYVNIEVTEGQVYIGEHCMLNGTKNSPVHISVNGALHIEHHNVVYGNITVRFNGVCNIGSYNGIMHQTEIRCDESINIGSFNMISYDCMIYDTNTHCQLDAEIRQQQTINDYPWIGKEYQKPVTAPVIIGSHCWLGKRSVVLKGVIIGNGVTVGAQAVVTKNISDGALAYGNPAIIKMKNVL